MFLQHSFFSNVKAYINDSEEAGLGNNYGDLEKKLRVRLDECVNSVASRVVKTCRFSTFMSKKLSLKFSLKTILYRNHCRIDMSNSEKDIRMWSAFLVLLAKIRYTSPTEADTQAYKHVEIMRTRVCPCVILHWVIIDPALFFNVV